ncbi:MAG: hypothetical protein PHU27_09585 [Salinivirgaceae bacterium]|nr:hypothetical protein [Salinivirgaceae bacterium]
MRNKLGTFSEFTKALYPHELDYLVSIQRFSKPENLKILNLVLYNSKNPLNPILYDSSIDKRTYSYLKNWISETLDKVDVDKYYNWLLTIEQSVMSDSITAHEEDSLMEQISIINSAHYNFIRFYQVLQHYRDYLLVRNRIRYFTHVSEYLESYKKPYEKVQRLNNDMNNAAEHVIKQLTNNKVEYHRWEKLFKEIYYDSKLDGYTRYRAVVRLTILYYTNRDFEPLSEIYDHLDLHFKTDVFYSKRILANYYHNRAMMHSKLKELEVAEKYGFLSIRQKNSDFLFYLVSLCNILLRKKNYTLALQLMSESMPELKKSNSFHGKIGYASFYIKTLLANNLADRAESYATTYFESYKKEIFQYRWHLFITIYIQALLATEKYSKIVSLSRRYKLVAKEKQFLGKAAYLPIISWYTALAEYIECTLSKDAFKDVVLNNAKPAMETAYKSQRVFELLGLLELSIPDIIKEIREELK